MANVSAAIRPILLAMASCFPIGCPHCTRDDGSADLGTLEPGKLADIVILDGNPLDGYWHLLNARVVIKGGDVVVDKR
jgi:hypothetical protein